MLQIQVHIKLPKPGPGIEYSRDLLNEIAERWLKSEPIPKRIKVTAISWRSGAVGRWKSENNPHAMLRVRVDFRNITEAGPFEFTGSAV